MTIRLFHANTPNARRELSSVKENRPPADEKPGGRFEAAAGFYADRGQEWQRLSRRRKFRLFGQSHGGLEIMSAGLAGPGVADMAVAQKFRGFRGDKMIAAAGAAWVTQITPELERERCLAAKAHGDAPCFVPKAKKAVWQARDGKVKVLCRIP
ncbi:MAG TPA: hypothetical protein VFK79_02975 [Xanthobacteraceae bacterium]|nr:hypothetical protein [Xanthobacteraceae bacterium]